MEELLRAIRTTPIIDNHAHPLLLPAFQGKYDLLAITTEAHGDAMKATKSTLDHLLPNAFNEFVVSSQLLQSSI